MAGFLTGLIQGFNDSTAQARQQNQDRLDKQDERENAILTGLLHPDVDPELRNAAMAALVEKGTGKKPPKGGYLQYLTGNTEAPSYPMVSNVMRMMQPQVHGGMSVDAVGAEPGGGSSTPQPAAPSAAPVTATQPTPAGESAAMPATAMADHPPSPSALTPPPSVQPQLQQGANLPVVPFVPPPTHKATTPTVSTPRSVFLDPDEVQRRASVAKAQGDVQGEIAGLEAAGMAHPAALQLIQDKYARLAHGGAAGSINFVAGELPDGTLAYGVEDKRPGSPTFGKIVDQDGTVLPGFRPRTTAASTSMGADNESTARALFGKPYAQLSSSEQQHVLDTVVQRAGTRAGVETSAREAATNQGLLGRPVGVATGASQGIDPTTTLGQLHGITPITAEQRQRVDGAVGLVSQLQVVQDLVKKVFPPGSGLGAGVTAAAVLTQKKLQRDPDYAQLQAAIGPLQSIVARFIAQEKGNLSQGDVARAAAALPNLEAGLLSGDTQESALARIQEVLNLAQQVTDQIKTPASQLQQRQGATPPPSGTTGAGATAPPPGAPRVGQAVGNVFVNGTDGTVHYSPSTGKYYGVFTNGRAPVELKKSGDQYLY